jgi:hypothetical protein
MPCVLSQHTQLTPVFSIDKTNRYGVQGGVSRPVIRLA